MLIHPADITPDAVQNAFRYIAIHIFVFLLLNVDKVRHLQDNKHIELIFYSVQLASLLKNEMAIPLLILSAY